MRAKPKKSLGQNFLTDKNIQQKIVMACDINESDCILEIGAGQGDMTRLLADKAQTIFALEIDKELCPILESKLLDAKNSQIINSDFLKFDLVCLTKQLKINKLKVVGNIPYYVTSPIIERLIAFKNVISQAFLTVQKEVAQRIVAKHNTKEYGAFSCFVQYHSDAKILFNIKNNSFYPIPKVDSSFIKLDFQPQNREFSTNEERLFKIIRTAFSQRRKTLRNSLKYIIPKEKLDTFFIDNTINVNIRPEELSLKDFSILANI